jgi:hypothetical protein
MALDFSLRFGIQDSIFILTDKLSICKVKASKRTTKKGGVNWPMS